MSKSDLDKTIARLETGIEMVKRLEKLTGELDDLFGEVGFMECLEEELQRECIYFEGDHIGLTGSATYIRWSFEDIIESWNEVYDEECEESRAALQRMGEQCCKLGEMFKEKAAEVKV
jgi:hypothetical protein